MHVRLGKMSDYISLDNLELLKKHWESLEFNKLSTQNNKNCNNNADVVRPSLHTCEAISMTEWHKRMVRISSLSKTTYKDITNPMSLHCMQLVTLEREPIIDELLKDTHQQRPKKKKGNWVYKKSE